MNEHIALDPDWRLRLAAFVRLADLRDKKEGVNLPHVERTRARGEARTWDELLAEYEAVRQATLALFRSLDTGSWTRAGIANGYPVSPDCFLPAGAVAF